MWYTFLKLNFVKFHIVFTNVFSFSLTEDQTYNSAQVGLLQRFKPIVTEHSKSWDKVLETETSSLPERDQDEILELDLRDRESQ